MNIPKFLRLCLLLFGLLAFEQKALASHLFGGEIKYKFLDASGPTGRPYRYQVTYLIYNNCGSSSGVPGGNATINVRFYAKSSSGPATIIQDLNPSASGCGGTTPNNNWPFKNAYATNCNTNPVNIPPKIKPPVPPGCPFTINQCVELVRYERIVELPISLAGYYTVFDLGARIAGIDNLQQSNQETLTLYADIPPAFRVNSSPVFTDTAVAVMCSGDTATIINNATDPDGDRLIYSFTSSSSTFSTGGLGNTFTTPPPSVQYNTAQGFSVAQPFGPGGYAFLNATSGLTKYYIPNAGEYVVTFLVKEYRTLENGAEILVGTSLRDVQIFVTNQCGTNTAPKLKIPASGYTVKAGASQTIKIRGTDADSLSQPITFSGEIFAPSGTKIVDLAKVTQSGQSIVTNINFSSICSQPGVYTIKLKLQDQACPVSKSDSKIILITVPPFKGPTIKGDSIVCNTGRNKYFVTRGSGSDVSAVKWKIASGAGTIFPGVTTDTVYVQWTGIGGGSLQSKFTSTFGCLDSTARTVTVSQGVTPSFTGLAATYCLNSGSVTLVPNISGGTFSGSGITAGGVFTPSAASVGTHIITYTVTNNACKSTATASVTVSPNPTPDFGNLNQTSYCKGAAAITAPANSSYSINGGAPTQIFDPATLNVGNYTVVVTTTSGGCSATASKAVSIYAVPGPSLAFLPNTFCRNDAAVALPAGTNITYVIDGGSPIASGAVNPASLSVGTHTVVINENNGGCIGTTSKTVTVNAAPTPSLAVLANNYCKDAAVVTLPAAATGNTIEYKVNGTVASTFNPQTLAAGTYTVSATETVTATGCNTTTSKTVVVNALPTPSLTFLNTSYCKDAAAVTLVAGSGGVITKYTVNGVKQAAGTQFNPQTLAPGTYTVVATDSITGTGCKASTTKTVTINALPTANLAFLNTSYCKDANAITFPAAVTGNTIVYNIGTTTSTSFDPQTLAAGTYTVTATESITATGCTKTSTKQVTVNALPTPTLAFLNTSYCKDAAAVTLTAGSGGVFTRYIVNGVKQAAGTQFNPQTLTAGTYTVVAIDSISATGCKASTSKTVTINALPTANFATLANAYCKDAAAVSLAIAGSDYYIDGSSTKALTFNPAALSAGNHTVLVTTTNAAGCSATGTKTIAIIEAVPNFGALTANAYCKDAAPITAPAGNTYSINGGTATTTFNPATLAPGSYNVAVTATATGSALTCTATATKTVTINANPTPSLAMLANSYCKDAAAITFPAAVTGNTIEYKINGTVATSFNPQTLAAGTYTVSALETITATGCNATTSKTVVVNALPTPTLAFLNTSYCKDAAAVTFPAAVTGNTIEYKVNGSVASSFDPQTLAAGTYTVSALETITATGCTATTTKTVVVNALPNPSLAFLATSYCKDAAAVTLPAAIAGNTIVYQIDGVTISTGTFNPASLAVGPRTITALETITTTGCSKLVTKTVTINANPTPSLAFLNNAYCKDASVINFPAAVTGNSIEYKVNGTVATSFNPQTLAVGTYTISALETINATGCNATSSKTVTINELPTPSLAFLNSSYCKDATSVNLPAGSGGNTIAYQIDGVAVTGTFNPATLSVGPRVITAQETIPGTGCTATVTKTVTINPTPLADPVSGPVSVCPGITGIPYKIVNPRETSYVWTISGGSGTIVSGQNTDKIMVNWGSTPTTATISVQPKNPQGCFGPATTYNVTINPILITPQPLGTLSVCLKQGDSVRYVMPAPTPGSSFSWTVNGGTIVGQNNTTVRDTVYIKWTTPGTGTITVQEASTGAVNCFGNSTPLSVTVLASPNGNLPINGPASICEATPNVAFTLNGGQNSTYAWTLTQNGNTTTLGSTSNTVSVNIGGPGQYVFTAIETNAALCVGSPITKVVTVTPKPVTDTIYGPSYICPESLANHWYSVKGPAGATYNWQVTGGTFAATNNDSILVTFDKSPVKQITVTPTSAAGCVGATYTRTIIYDPLEIVLTTITTGDIDDNVMVINFTVKKNSTNSSPIDIYRREIPSTTFTKVGSVPNTAISFTDTNVDTHNKIYEYKVQSFNQCGTLIESSKHVAVLLAKATANEAAKTVTLTWNPYKGWGAGGVKEYQVYGKADNGTYKYLYTVNGTDSTAILINIAANGFNQCFRIKAVGIDGRISWSNSTCTTFENKLVIYNIITPNGDDKNDKFTIENVHLYPGNELTIFNRWGNQVYSKKDYMNEWSGEGQSAGTYYYLLKLKNGQTYKGWVEVVK